MTSPIAYYPKSGIRVVIVGAGFGGLAAAIECHFKGHDVVVVERCKDWQQLGDIISLLANAGLILYRWDRNFVHRRLRDVCMDYTGSSWHTHKGERISKHVSTPLEGRPAYHGHRADIHRVLYDYAVSLGIPIMMGKKVLEWKEDEKSAWIVVEGEEIVKGDLVVAANGVRSKAKNVVLEGTNHGNQAQGSQDKHPLYSEKSSGYAVYRTWYNGEEAGIAKDPLTKVLAEKDIHMGWIGEDAHLLVASFNRGKKISWVATHRTTKEHNLSDDSEDWMNPLPGKVQEALSLFENWAPVCKAIVSKTKTCIDFPIIIRDPLPSWVSPKQRICLLGDSAHPFLPTSVQGASQAIEDGVVLATVLSLSRFSASIPTNKKVQAALQAYERLRCERVKAAQKQGIDVMENWHRTDWEEVRRNPEMIKLPVNDWLVMHDSEKWTRGIWEEWVAEWLGKGKVSIPKERLACGRDSVEVHYSGAQT